MKGCWVLFLALSASWCGTPASAQEPAADVVGEATRLYDQSRFEDAIRILNEAIRGKQVSGDDLARARAILARSYVKSGRRMEGKETFKDMLRADPGYRPDPVATPPDELEVFNLALKEYQQELIEVGRRIPTSLSGYVGYGMYALDDLNEEFVTDNPELEEIKGGFEFGGQIRVPLRSRFSLEFELAHFQGETEDVDGNKLQAVGMPLMAGVAWTFWSTPRLRASTMIAGGLLLKAGVQVPFLIPDIQLSVTKTGFYSHAGLEGEFMILPRYSVTGRVLGRYAKATKVFETDTSEGFEADFSGLAFQGGLRAYVGY